MVSKLRWLAFGGVILIAAWIFVNPFGVQGLPWGWGKAVGPQQSDCSYLVVHIRAADTSLISRWPTKDPSTDIASLREVTTGPLQGGAQLDSPSVRNDGNQLVFTGPSGDYVWDSLGTFAPCAGLIHVASGQSTTFGSSVVRIKPAATPTAHT